jgi:hypothetical protein
VPRLNINKNRQDDLSGYPDLNEADEDVPDDDFETVYCDDCDEALIKRFARDHVCQHA